MKDDLEWFLHFMLKCEHEYVTYPWSRICLWKGKVPDFLAWFSKSYGQQNQQNPFWVPRRPLRQFSAMSDIYLFIPPPINIKINYSAWYWPKSFQFGQSAQFGSGLDVYEWGWTWVKIQSCSILEEGVLRGQKLKIFCFLRRLVKN